MHWNAPNRLCRAHRWLRYLHLLQRKGRAKSANKVVTMSGQKNARKHPPTSCKGATPKATKSPLQPVVVKRTMLTREEVIRGKEKDDGTDDIIGRLVCFASCRKMAVGSTSVWKRKLNQTVPLRWNLATQCRNRIVYFFNDVSRGPELMVLNRFGRVVMLDLLISLWLNLMPLNLFKKAVRLPPCLFERSQEEWWHLYGFHFM